MTYNCRTVVSLTPTSRPGRLYFILLWYTSMIFFVNMYISLFLYSFFFFVFEQSTDRFYWLFYRFAQMSVVPLVFRDWWDDIDRPVSRLLDQHFGTGLHRDDLISSLTGLGFNRAPLRSIFGNTYYRPWRNMTRQNSSGSSTIQLENENFQVGI